MTVTTGNHDSIRFHVSEKLFRHIILTQSALEGEVELVFSAEFLKARVVMATGTLERATTPVDIHWNQFLKEKEFNQVLKKKTSLTGWNCILPYNILN